MENVELITPCSECRQQYFEVRREYEISNEKPTFGLNFKHDSFDEVIDEINNIKTGTGLPAHQVQRDIYWLVHRDSKKIIGVINIRGLSTEYFIKVGGNIRYGVRPSERRKGYASKMLSLALEKCRDKGYKRVLLTCQSSNIASEKAILKNGGKFDSEIIEDGVLFFRYWIEL